MRGARRISRDLIAVRDGSVLLTYFYQIEAKPVTSDYSALGHFCLIMTKHLTPSGNVMLEVAWMSSLQFCFE
jgi:hypothetical protein